MACTISPVCRGCGRFPPGHVRSAEIDALCRHVTAIGGIVDGTRLSRVADRGRAANRPREDRGADERCRTDSSWRRGQPVGPQPRAVDGRGRQIAGGSQARNAATEADQARGTATFAPFLGLRDRRIRENCYSRRMGTDALKPYLVILTGPSRAGKTSPAAELSKALPSRPLHVEADAYLPKAYADDSWYAANQGPLALALHRPVLPWVEAGYSVILDGSLPSAPGLRARCLEVLEGIPRAIIGVVCSPAELIRRAEMTARSPSWCIQQLTDFSQGIELCTQVDTSELSLQQCIQQVAGCLPIS